VNLSLKYNGAEFESEFKNIMERSLNPSLKKYIELSAFIQILQHLFIELAAFAEFSGICWFGMTFSLTCSM
jgi:hypothetical protein